MAASSSTNGFWHLMQPEYHLFQYTQLTEKPDKICAPILMLHGTLSSHRSWTILAQQFWNAGMDNLYALDLPEVTVGNSIEHTIDLLTNAINYLLDECYPHIQQLVLIGYGSGGIIANRYWQSMGELSRLSYLFMLATPHDTTVFPSLQETIIGRGNSELFETSNVDMTATQSPAVDFTKIKSPRPHSNTVLVNIIGNQVGPDFDAVARGLHLPEPGSSIISHPSTEPTFDGTVRGLYLPEAVSLVLPLLHPMDHNDMNKDYRVGEAIMSCLRGDWYQVKLKLVGIRLQRDDGENLAGPVAFEIDGNRMPPDTVFQGIVDRLYIFEENVPPICTLRYPVDDISCTITLQLKDLSEKHGRRRRMYVRLHIPLVETNGTTHTMQDSEGSDYLWRIVCQRMPKVLIDPAVPEKKRTLSRGI